MRAGKRGAWRAEQRNEPLPATLQPFKLLITWSLNHLIT
jgi:hypothetical protein